jgi:soluble lytic murein transglycosylase
MSSMWRAILLGTVLLVVAPASSAQYSGPVASTAPAASPYATQNVAYALSEWRNLRQSSNYRFADYARFVIANPDWPDVTRMRGWAEKAMQPGENNATVLAFFAADKPTSGNGWARLADADAANARMTEALDAARQAWASSDLSDSDVQAIWARYGANLTRADHDRRVDSLLFAKKPDDASRFLQMTSPERQAAFAARIAMQTNAPDAAARYQSVSGTVTRDAGLMMDRMRYLRANNYEEAAAQLAGRAHSFVYKPADPERFFDLLSMLADEAVQSRNWDAAWDIASQVDDVIPAGAAIADQPLGVRDDYTSLAWLAGNVALDRLNRPAGALAMFARYALAGRSLQVQTKGDYWAARAELAAGKVQEANSYFARAASHPDLFYGQLALERLGRTVTPPPTAATQYATTSIQRSAFYGRGLVQAVRLLGQQGRTSEQALFVRALAESLTNDADRNLAVEFSQQISRPDLAVWTARLARIKGSSFYVKQAFPTLPTQVSADLWSLAHGISRQESSFDPYAISHAGARGMMQLMPGTASDQARKMGVGFDDYRLLSDPAYNVSLGSAYFQHLLDVWDGSVPLAVASYNAGAGNVRKWINANGDPRGQVDMLKWIEAIPFTETRGSVQRVIENSVVYDSLRGTAPQQSALHVSRYLGKNRPA